MSYRDPFPTVPPPQNPHRSQEAEAIYENIKRLESQMPGGAAGYPGGFAAQGGLGVGYTPGGACREMTVAERLDMRIRKVEIELQMLRTARDLVGRCAEVDDLVRALRAIEGL